MDISADAYRKEPVRYSRLGREDCTVIIVADGVTDLNEGDGWRSVPNLGIRATDKSGSMSLKLLRPTKVFAIAPPGQRER